MQDDKKDYRLNLRIDPETRERIEAWRDANRDANKDRPGMSEAVRVLLTIALGHEGV